MLKEKIVNLNDFKQDRIRTESTDLCRYTLDRTLYIYNNEIYPETILLKLLKNAAGLLEKKLKLDEINKCSDLADDLVREINTTEREISCMAKEINNILDKLAESKSISE